jgi:hypothetical protein
MGRYLYTYRRILEDVPRITFPDLKLWGYLTDKSERSGILTLSKNGKKTGSLNIAVKTDSESCSFIEFEYLLNGKPVKYRHAIELFPCHYGNHRFYFICRDTGQRVTSLYMMNGYFSSRHYHRLVYQCSRDHRSIFNLQNKEMNIRKKAEWFKVIGHPTIAKQYFRKAEYCDELSLITFVGKLKMKEARQETRRQARGKFRKIIYERCNF